MQVSILRTAALACLAETQPAQKVRLVSDLKTHAKTGDYRNNSDACPERLIPRGFQGVNFTSDSFNDDLKLLETRIPGRPDKPLLVPPIEVKKRSMRTLEGRAALIHALAHIEFNAINLALDAIWRFTDMPEEFYLDWLQVAQEEAYHFSLLESHLQSMGYRYGDFTAHNSLWEMAERTAHDVLARMALVPRTLEARGLDASPPLRNKLAQIGDIKAAEILDIILRDEIGHVAIGNRWFNWLCAQGGLEPVTAYQHLAAQYKAPKLHRPFNLEARRKAGFSETELALLAN